MTTRGLGARSADGSPEIASSAPPRMLFVGHEASRTGAPMMFLHFVRWLRDNTDLDFEILLLNGGPLADDFAEAAPTTLVHALGSGRRSYLEGGIARAGFPQAADRLKVARTQRAVRRLKGFDGIYLNSTTSSLALRILPEVPPLVMSHIHELDSAFTYWFPQRDRDILLSSTHRFIACAQAVARHLIGARGVPADQVACHYEFIQPPDPNPANESSIRRTLGIPPGARVVGASGVAIWRKAPDLFIQTAANVLRGRPDLDVHFVWVGGTDDERMPVQLDLDRMGLRDRVHFVGDMADPSDVFSLFDVFCLTSREDPYPLVMLETAALGVPVVSFANGGVVEFAGYDEQPPLDPPRAIVVPYLDVRALSDAIVDLLDDEEKRVDIGRRGQERVLTQHTVDVAAKGLYEEVLDALASPPGSPVRLNRLQPVGKGPTDPGTGTVIDDTAPCDAAGDGHRFRGMPEVVARRAGDDRSTDESEEIPCVPS